MKAMCANVLELPVRVRSEIEERALAAFPRECCGLLLGSREDGATSVLETRESENVHPGDLERRYSIAPQTFLDSLRDSRGRGLEIVGYYHSHPSGDAGPSDYDAETAWTGVSYLIVAVHGERVGELRSWRLEDPVAGFTEEDILYADRPVGNGGPHP